MQNSWQYMVNHCIYIVYAYECIMQESLSTTLKSITDTFPTVIKHAMMFLKSTLTSQP